MNVECLQCHREYIRPKSYRSKHNFCSEECKKEYLKLHKSFDSKKFICPVCGKEFFKQKRFIDEDIEHCCSRKCSIELKKQKFISNTMCDFCGKEFHKKPGRIRQINFCSKKCQNLYRNKDYPSHIDEIIELHKNGKYDREIAEQYGVSRAVISRTLKKYYFEPNGIKENRKRKIDDVELRKRISDSVRKTFEIETDNKDEFDSISKEAKHIFSSISYLFKLKHNFTCQKCGKRGSGKIETHHIYKISHIIRDFIRDFYKKENGPVGYQLMNYEPFTDENNLMVLCRKCHLEEHLKKIKKSGINK